MLHETMLSFKRNRKKILLVVIWSYLFSLSCVLPIAITNHTIISCLAMALIPAIVVSAILFPVLKGIAYLRERITPLSPEIKSRPNLLLIILASLVLVWGIAWLICYPGCCSTDSNDIFKMVLGLPFESNHFRYDTINNHHPAVYVGMIWMVFAFAQACGLTETMAVGLVSLIHLLILACCCAFVTRKVYSLSNSRYMLVLTWLFFLLNPLIMQYSVTVWKDVLFSGFFLVFIIQLVELVFQPNLFFNNKSNTIILVLSAIFSSLLRNNAFPVIILTFACLLLFTKNHRKQIGAILVSIVLVVLLVIGPLFSLAGVRSGHFSESVGIPLQQIGKVFAENGNVTNEQLSFFSKILPAEDWKESYSEKSPDRIKFHSNFNDDYLEQNKAAFFTNWFMTGVQNPGDYLRAWLDQTVSFWSIDGNTWYTCDPGYCLNDDRIAHNLAAPYLDYSDLKTCLDVATKMAPSLYNIGILVWLMLFIVLFALYFKRRNLLLCLIPLIFLWATFLLAAPASDFRYMFVFHLAIPVFVLLIFFKIANSNNSMNSPYNTEQTISERTCTIGSRL